MAWPTQSTERNMSYPCAHTRARLRLSPFLPRSLRNCNIVLLYCLHQPLAPPRHISRSAACCSRPPSSQSDRFTLVQHAYIVHPRLDFSSTPDPITPCTTIRRRRCLNDFRYNLPRQTRARGVNPIKLINDRQFIIARGHHNRLYSDIILYCAYIRITPVIDVQNVFLSLIAPVDSVVRCSSSIGPTKCKTTYVYTLYAIQ